MSFIDYDILSASSSKELRENLRRKSQRVGNLSSHQTLLNQVRADQMRTIKQLCDLVIYHNCPHRYQMKMKSLTIIM